MQLDVEEVYTALFNSMLESVESSPPFTFQRVIRDQYSMALQVAQSVDGKPPIAYISSITSPVSHASEKANGIVVSSIVMDRSLRLPDALRGDVLLDTLDAIPEANKLYPESMRKCVKNLVDFIRKYKTDGGSYQEEQQADYYSQGDGITFTFRLSLDGQVLDKYGFLARISVTSDYIKQITKE